MTQLTVDNAAEWRTPCGARVVRAEGSDSGVSVCFDEDVRCPRAYYYASHSTMDVNSTGWGIHSHIQLIHDPLPIAFWLVWTSARGYSSPSFRHPTEDAANTEAERLAGLNPGQEFYTVKVISRSVAERVAPVVTKTVLN